MGPLNLDSEVVLPIRVQIGYRGHDEIRKENVECHFWVFSNSGIDFYRVIAGRMMHIASYNDVVYVEEIV